nr:pentatricopeptide repeat-containing protein At2g16880-like [Arachis hypogaea]
MKGSGVSPNRNTYNILVHGYCKLRWLKEATEVIKLIRANDMVPDIWTYNTIMRGLCDEGKVKKAISHRDDMECLRVMPDEVTYNTLIDRCFQWRGSVEAFNGTVRKVRWMKLAMSWQRW